MNAERAEAAENKFVLFCVLGALCVPIFIVS
jgi:hypothetical protein